MEMKYWKAARQILQELGINYSIIHWANKEGFLYSTLNGERKYFEWK